MLTLESWRIRTIQYWPLFRQVSTHIGCNQLHIFHCTNVHQRRHTSLLINFPFISASSCQVQQGKQHSRLHLWHRSKFNSFSTVFPRSSPPSGGQELAAASKGLNSQIVVELWKDNRSLWKKTLLGASHFSVRLHLIWRSDEKSSTYFSLKKLERCFKKSSNKFIEWAASSN